MTDEPTGQEVIDDMIKWLQTTDPDRVAFASFVMIFKDDEEDLAGKIISDNLDGFESPADVMYAIARYNAVLDKHRMPTNLPTADELDIMREMLR